MRTPFIPLPIALVAVALSTGCTVFGNRYNGQYEIECPQMQEAELRAEIKNDAARISEAVGQPVTVVVDRPTQLILNVQVPSTRPRSFWHGGPQSVAVRLSYDADRPRLRLPALFIAVFRPNNPSEDETILKARSAVETTLKSSRCPKMRFYVNRFSLVGP